MSAQPTIEQQADAILQRHRGVAHRVAVGEMRQAIAAWLAARPAQAPPTDVLASDAHARRLLLEAMDRVQQAQANR